MSFLSRLQLNLSPSDYLNVHEPEKSNKDNVYLTSTVLLWTLFYIIFKAYFNAFLRQKNINLTQRIRIINLTWSWSFHALALIYLRFYHLSEVPSDSNLYLVYLLMKGFSLHFVGVKVLSCNTWMTGFSHLLFTLFVFNDFNYCFSPHYAYVLGIKIVDILILEACRFLFILWKDNCGNIFSVFLLVIHWIYWVLMYLYFTPNFLLSPDKEIDSSRLLYFYLWYSTECIDLIWLKLFKFRRTEPWLKTFLFASTEESALLMSIYKRHEEGSHKKNIVNSRLKRQIDLWKTVKCAIAVKKTLNRKRKAQIEKQQEIQNTGVEEKK